MLYPHGRMKSWNIRATAKNQPTPMIDCGLCRYIHLIRQLVINMIMIYHFAERCTSWLRSAEQPHSQRSPPGPNLWNAPFDLYALRIVTFDLEGRVLMGRGRCALSDDEMQEDREERLRAHRLTRTDVLRHLPMPELNIPRRRRHVFYHGV